MVGTEMFVFCASDEVNSDSCRLMMEWILWSLSSAVRLLFCFAATDQRSYLSEAASQTGVFQRGALLLVELHHIEKPHGCLFALFLKKCLPWKKKHISEKHHGNFPYLSQQYVHVHLKENILLEDEMVPLLLWYIDCKWLLSFLYRSVWISLAPASSGCLM